MSNAPVVLLHGLGSSFDHGWRQPGWVDLLREGGRDVPSVDLLGHGSAAKPHDPEAYRALEDEALAAMPAGVVDGVGFSLGAQVLLRLAAREPGRFGRLVLIGVGESLFRRDDPAFLVEAFERGDGGDDVGAQLFVRFASGAGADLAALAACLRRPSQPFTADELAAVTCPVLVVIGDRDFAGPGEPLAAALPDAQLTVLPGVDHFQVTRDFGCIDAALGFLGLSI